MTLKRQRRPGAGVGAEGIEHTGNVAQSKNTTPRRRPPYSRQFTPGAWRCILIRVGWPGRLQLPGGEIVLPDTEPADRFGWSLVRGQPVFCAPPQGFTADQGHLHELGMVLVASGASVVQLFDGERVVTDWWADASERPRGAA
ncbi:MAG: hypothetical protein ACOY42_06810 [Pseudomonadota bacterium]